MVQSFAPDSRFTLFSLLTEGAIKLEFLHYKLKTYIAIVNNWKRFGDKGHNFQQEPGLDC